MERYFPVISKAPSKRNATEAKVKKRSESKYKPYPSLKDTITSGHNKFAQFSEQLQKSDTRPSLSGLTKFVLSTLSDESNPITHSDIRERSDHVVSISTGHQVGDRQLDRGLYLKDRECKLAVQREVKASSGENQVLRNVRVYINGYLENTTDLEMKKVVTRAGGTILPTASGCTHIVTSMQLSASKTHKLLTTKSRMKVHVVKPEWVFDSIKRGKRQAEREYTIIKDSTMKSLQDITLQKKENMMKATWVLLASLLAPAFASVVLSAGEGDSNPLEVIRLRAPDDSARADFIAFGATVTNFWVKDKIGRFRDILLGYDNHTMYKSEADGHPYFGPIVGRIRNGTFTIPISKDASGPGRKYYVPRNEGNNTLHGGTYGYDQRSWTVAKKSAQSVTFTLVDPDGTEGFPGTVTTQVTYTLEAKSTWKMSIDSVATDLTPIMLSGHHYWNLEAYEETQDLVGHHAQFQASKFVTTDGTLIPNGQLTNVAGTPMDFRKAKSIGGSINATASAEYCGTGKSESLM
ncbi:hypothetical protein H0H93_000093 [Arthromyces matolae]|nr:hypothetical protein H0H93_000093 [Arthromyces matolae]